MVATDLVEYKYCERAVRKERKVMITWFSVLALACQTQYTCGDLEGFVVAFVRSQLNELRYATSRLGCSWADSRGCVFRSARSTRVLLVAVLRDPTVW